MKRKLLYAITIIFVGLILLSNKTYAANEGIEIKYNDNLISGTKTIGIVLNKDNENRCITKTDIMSIDGNITEITNIESGDLVRTGSTVTRGNETYTIILYGDANGDGTICDADDIMIIINDYLGTEEIIGINRVAANLANSDDVLDIDDIVIMMNMYLGTLNEDLVSDLPDSNIDSYDDEGDLTLGQGIGFGYEDVRVGCSFSKFWTDYSGGGSSFSFDRDITLSFPTDTTDEMVPPVIFGNIHFNNTRKSVVTEIRAIWDSIDTEYGVVTLGNFEEDSEWKVFNTSYGSITLNYFLERETSFKAGTPIVEIRFRDTVTEETTETYSIILGDLLHNYAIQNGLNNN